MRLIRNTLIGGALRAAGDAKTPLRLGILLTVLNITLNVILIRGLGPIPAFGTQGAAMGTVISGLVVSSIATRRAAESVRPSCATASS